VKLSEDELSQFDFQEDKKNNTLSPEQLNQFDMGSPAQAVINENALNKVNPQQYSDAYDMSKEDGSDVQTIIDNPPPPKNAKVGSVVFDSIVNPQTSRAVSHKVNEFTEIQNQYEIDRMTHKRSQQTVSERSPSWVGVRSAKLQREQNESIWNKFWDKSTQSDEDIISRTDFELKQMPEYEDLFSDIVKESSGELYDFFAEGRNQAGRSAVL